MKRRLLAVVPLVFLLALCAAQAQSTKPLQIYFVDVEGGQATLFVTPAGESLLIDTGWPGERDSARITELAKAAGVSRLDYVLVTHYHVDHVGGVPDLVKKLPVATFIDHGPLREHGSPMDQNYADYEKTIAATHAKRVSLKPGEKLPLRGIEGVVVSGDGEVIDQALPGAGQPNAFCKTTEQRPADQTENARSLGVLFAFGKLKILDLGDLTWDKELPLVCPMNKLGHVDIYIVSHHGFEQSGSPALVQAIAPRVAIMDNGAKKGGSRAPWQTIADSPDLETLWQLHYSIEGGKQHNVADTYIANVGETDQGNYLKLTGYPDGHFEVFNSRTNSSKAYAAR